MCCWPVQNGFQVENMVTHVQEFVRAFRRHDELSETGRTVHDCASLIRQDPSIISSKYICVRDCFDAPPSFPSYSSLGADKGGTGQSCPSGSFA